MQTLRREITLIIVVMMACDVFLNKIHAKENPAVCAKVLQYLGTLGITKGDLVKVSPKLVAQINEVDGTKGKKRPSVSGSESKGDVANGPNEPENEPVKKLKKEAKNRDKADKDKKEKSGGAKRSRKGDNTD